MPNVITIDCTLHDYKLTRVNGCDCKLQAFTESNGTINWYHSIRFKDPKERNFLQPNKLIKFRYNEKSEIEAAYERVYLFPTRSLSQLMYPVESCILDRVAILAMEYIVFLTSRNLIQSILFGSHVGRNYCENLACIASCNYSATYNYDRITEHACIPMDPLFANDNVTLYFFHVNWYFVQTVKNKGKLFKQINKIFDIYKYLFFKSATKKSAAKAGNSTVMCFYEDRCKLKNNMSIFIDYENYIHLHELLCAPVVNANKIDTLTRMYVYVERIKDNSKDSWLIERASSLVLSIIDLQNKLF